MNQAIFKEMDHIKRENLYAQPSMRKRCLEVRSRSNGQFYKMMVDVRFQKDSHSSKMANSFIDFVNLDVVEANRNIPLIFITEEDLFNEMMDKVDLECLNDTKEFYKEYYLDPKRKGKNA